ncbi:MAG: 4Fe-4S binding protein [Candidatus Bathyarchaeia archaeon]
MAPRKTIQKTAIKGRLKAEIHIIEDHCKGCGLCIYFCPENVLGESREINARGVHPPTVIDYRKCILCSLCTAICPDFAIFVTGKSIEDESYEC